MRISDWSSDVCSSDLSGEDFSRVEGRREARAADPAATSAEAEAIFGAIDTLIVDGSTDAQMKLGVALGIVGSRLPHGQRDLTIQKLISLAPRQARAGLLLSLVLSGEDIDIKLVADRSEEHTSELQSLMRISYAVFCLKKKK